MIGYVRRGGGDDDDDDDDDIDGDKNNFNNDNKDDSKEEEEEEGHGEEVIKCMVTEEYLGVLVRLANERFEANAERTRRFEEEVMRLVGVGEGDGMVMGKPGASPNQESKAQRNARKKAAGLLIQQRKHAKEQQT